MNPPGLLDYRYEDLLAERALVQSARQTKPDIVHVLFGDEQLDYLLHSEERLPCPLVVSFHLPTHRAAGRLNLLGKDQLERIDAVILLATYQLPEYREWFPAEKLFYVPHGMDTSLFRPGPRLPADRELRLLSVGEHMRDWEVLDQVNRLFEKHDIPLRHDVVGGRAEREVLRKYERARLHPRLEEAELIELYQKADVLFLPVVAATANNSAIEALACGTPVISNAVGGMPDYVDSGSGWLLPNGDVQGTYGLIAAAASNRQIFEKKRTGAREKVLRFDWKIVADEVHEVYRDAQARFHAAHPKPADK